jgi:hypothetical protein
MTDEWFLMSCSCGHCFGSQKGGLASCSKCGLSSSRRIDAFTDAIELAQAVSSANLPKEISHQMARRAHSYEALHKGPKLNARASASELLRAMRSATDSAGHLTISSVAYELRRMEISELTAERLVGQAEMEGVLMRSSKDTWSWLQQSS